MNPIKLATNYVRRQLKLMKNADNYNCHPDVPAKEHRVNVFEYHPNFKGSVLYQGQPYNLGDSLGPLIVKYLLDQKGIDINAEIPEKKHLFTVGSMIVGKNSGGNYQSATIWGSGVVFKLAPYASFFQRICRRKLDIRAVRGPKTRKVLRRYGHQCPEVYGDPAILMPMLYNPTNVEKKYDKLIIPQFLRESEFRKAHPNERIVSMNTDDYKYVIDEILASKIVYTSSLHGIILAETYGVPAVFFRGLAKRVDFKYRDWYESTGRKDIKFADTYEEALKMTPPPLPDLKGLVQGLLDTFPYDLWTGGNTK